MAKVVTLGKEYIQICPVYQCGAEYRAYSEKTMCPVCFCSCLDVMNMGTNDREVILHTILENVE